MLNSDFCTIQALSKALTDEELFYLRAQFNLLEPKDGCVSLDNFRTVSDSLSPRPLSFVMRD